MTKNKGGRPRLPVDEKALEIMAKNHLPDYIIANCLGVSEDTLHRRYAEKIEMFKSMSVSKLANVLWDEAINKRRDYAIKILANKYLNIAERTEHTATIRIESYETLTIEQLKEKAQLLLVSNNE